MSEKPLWISGLELEDHPWLDGWRELREAELRSCEAEKLKSVSHDDVIFMVNFICFMVNSVASSTILMT